MSPRPNRSEHIAFWWPFIALALYLLLAYLVYFNFTALPQALTLKDEPLHPDRFIAERAAKINTGLTNLGVKVTGSPTNQVDAIQFILQQIRLIVADSNAVHKIEYEVQTAEKGIFQRSFLNSYYQHIENIVIRLSPAIGALPKHSLLVNSHFDSAVGSPGGADDSFMVANMLETVRVLTQSNETYEHSIVFLLNGAEETGLQGSHMFITQHPWAKDVRAFINLDSAGSGGKECLFQVTPGHSWMMNYYKDHAQHPFTGAWLEEMFQARFIPSDTDFRIFRDFGEIAGIDMATISNGYIYHTRFDTADIIPIESYQNTGDNILALTKALANANELRDLNENLSEDVIFFDYLGWFMISYSRTVGIIVNSIVSVVTLIGIVFSLRRFTIKSGISNCHMLVEFAVILVVQTASILVGIGTVVVLAIVYDALYHSMTWFSNQWLVVGLYMFPFFLVLGLGPAIYLKACQIRAARWRRSGMSHNTLTRGSLIQMFLHAHALVLVVLCLVLTGLGIRSAYIVTMALVFYGASTWINFLTKWQNSRIHWVWVHLVAHLFPFLYHVNFLINLLVLLIPVQGRNGSTNNPEILFSLLVMGTGLLIAGFLIPVVGLVRRPIRTVVGIFVVLWLISVAIMFSPVGFPYREETSPQRYGVYHTDRTIHNFNQSILLNDHGFIMVGTDRHTNLHLDDAVSLETAVHTSSFCDKYVFCGVPINSPDALWIQAEPTGLSGTPTLKLLNQNRPTPNIKQFDFELSGPHHMTVVIAPTAGASISNWTLDKDTVLLTTPLLAQMTITSGKMSTPIQYSVSVESLEHTDQEPSLSIAVMANFVYHTAEETLEFRQFQNTFPAWTHVTSAMISYQSWQF